MAYTVEQVSKKIAKFIGDNHQHKIGSGAAGGGTMEEYPFGLLLDNQKQLALMITVAPETAGAAVRKNIKELLKKDGIRMMSKWTTGRPDDIVAVTLNPAVLGADYVAEGCRRTLRAVQNAGMQPARRCAFCGKEECDALGEYMGGYRPMHRACAENPAEAIKKNAARTCRLGQGTVGALLGLIAGIAVMALTAAIFGTAVLSLPFLLLPIFVFFGFKLLGKHINAKAFWLVAALIVLSLPVGLVTLGTAIYMEQSAMAFGTAFSEALALVFDLSHIASLLNISWLFLMCALVLLIAAWREAHILEEKNVQTSVKYLQQTLSDYDPTHTIRFDDQKKKNSNEA